jgi:hypothetical protein
LPRRLERAPETEAAHVQAILPMELGGFEPPTSWVRFRLLVAEGFARRRVARRDKWLFDAEFPTLLLRRKPAGPPKWESD